MAVVNKASEDKRMKDWLRENVKEERGWLGITIANKSASTTVDDVKWVDGTPITATGINNWANKNLTRYIQ